MLRGKRARAIFGGVGAALAVFAAFVTACGTDADPSSSAPDSSTEGAVATDATLSDAGPVVATDAGTQADSGADACSPSDIDTAFGDGGTVILAIAGSSSDVAYQSDGKLVLLGSSGGALIMVRIAADGALDPSFGDAGFSAAIVGEVGTKLAIQPNGDIVVIGSNGTLARYDNAGGLDPGFGEGGVITTGHPLTGLSLAPDGMIAVAGAQGASILISKYGSSGSLDTTFAQGGTFTWPLGFPCAFVGPNPTAFRASSGGVVFADVASCPDSPGQPDVAMALNDGGVRRFYPTVPPFVVTDIGVDHDGGTVLAGADMAIANLGFSASSGTLAGDARVIRFDSRGNVVVAGGLNGTFVGQATGLTLARYTSAHVLDPSFGTSGVIFVDGGLPATGADVLDCHIAVTGFTPAFAVMRFRSCCAN